MRSELNVWRNNLKCITDSSDRPIDDFGMYENSDSADRPKDNRKSQTVTFNELVERIDIETMPAARDSDDDIRL